MELWTETRTVLFVGRLGTVSAAAEAIGVHRATITRHIDSIEERLGIKLFIRYKDGYTITEAGKRLISIAEQTDLALKGFVDGLNIHETALSGTVKVAAVAKASPVVKAATKLFCARHPGARVQFQTTLDMPVLEKEEAHVVIRAGRKPQHLDYVPVFYFQFPIGLYGHRDYLAEFGTPQRVDDLESHRFVGSASVKEYFDLADRYGAFPSQQNVVFDSHDPLVVLDGILEGIGLGIAGKADALMHPDFLEVLPPQVPAIAPVWIITHVDLHRSPLIVAFIECLKMVKPDMAQDFSAEELTG
ncbi:MAG: LysR family transcriptional regulator [Pseudomonadota bacterium]